MNFFQIVSFWAGGKEEEQQQQQPQQSAAVTGVAAAAAAVAVTAAAAADTTTVAAAAAQLKEPMAAVAAQLKEPMTAAAAPEHVVLVVQGRHIPAHRRTLALVSNFFRVRERERDPQSPIRTILLTSGYRYRFLVQLPSVQCRVC
jgi:hypothetical protein